MRKIKLVPVAIETAMVAKKYSQWRIFKKIM